MDYKLNKVEGFDPYKYIEVAKDRNGEDIIKSDGTPLKYMSTAAKKVMFRMVHPTGGLKVEPVEAPKLDYGEIVRYKASVIVNGEVLAELEHQETAWDVGEMDQIVSKVQTIALGKALSAAGFGCEIELELGLQPEGTEEVPVVEPVAAEPPKKRGRPKKKVDEKAEEKEADVEAEVNELLASIESEIEAPEVPDAQVESDSSDSADQETLEEFYNMRLVVTDKAPINIKNDLEGMTIREVLDAYKDFGELVKTRPNIRNSISDECAKAIIFIEENK